MLRLDITEYQKKVKFQPNNSCHTPPAKTLQKHRLGYGSKGHATEIDFKKKKKIIFFVETHF
jgi:hypothetical protein